VEADTRQLRIDEDTGRNQTVPRAAPASVQVFVNNGKVIFRYMREVWTARAIPHSPHVRGGSFQPIVHADVSLFGDLDSRLLESDAAGVRRTSQRDENVATLHGSR